MKHTIKWNEFLLGLILGFALLVRFVGIQPGYPPYHEDEGITYSQGMAMILEASLNPKHGYGLPYNYPIIIPLVNATSYLSVFIPIESIKYLFSNPLDTLSMKSLMGQNMINVIYWARYTTAFFGVLIVYLIFLISKQIFSDKVTPLLAAFFTAINYRLVLNSHFGLPDIYNSFFLLVNIYFLIRLLKEKTSKNYLMVGISYALYFSTKFQFLTIPAMALVFLFVPKKKFWLTIISAVPLILILNTFHIIHWKETLDQVGYSALKYEAGRFSLDFFGYSYLYHIGLGKLMSISVLVGILIALKNKFKFSAILFLVIFSFFFMMTFYSGGAFYTRNFITIIPLLLIFSGYFVRSIGKKSVLISIIIFIFLSFESLQNALIVPLAYSKDWNFKLTDKWMEDSIPFDSKVLTTDDTIIPDNFTDVVRTDKIDSFFLRELQLEDVEWAIVDLDYLSRVYYWWMKQGTSSSLKFWNKPDNILINSPVAEMIEELKSYVVYEELNPWQASDWNYLVIHIPEEKLPSENCKKLIYENDFDESGWNAVNDGFGNLSNFVFDNDKGELIIKGNGSSFYSQRFESESIPVDAGFLYDFSAKLQSSQNLEWKDRDGFYGINFYDINSKKVKIALSERLYGSIDYLNRNMEVVAPNDSVNMKIFFQIGEFTKGDFIMDEIKVMECGKINVQNKTFYQSNYDATQHLFPNSHGGM